MLGDEEGLDGLWGLLTPQVLLLIVVVIVVVLLVVAGLAMLGWRRARRSGALDRGRRLLRRASLTVQAQAAPTQAAREVAGLRQQLAANVAVS
jgi:type II secretory pathway pseudopilin PulG